MAESIEIRLLAHSSPDDNGCLVWQRYRSRLGYGLVSFHGKPRRAHRVAYEVFVGPIRSGLVIDHLCRNRACVNVAHLEPVTQAINVARGDTGLHNKILTHCKRGHEFSAENTKVYSGMRHCLTCKRDFKRAKRAEMRG